ncbi:Crp/Fnr family transcriptional regulator [Azohydromonas caseinilytica]|uniref:Crp/Fnr family transcriptional regulator n=1 Tax=Azohydromonas caseinilytica TaxID=2728836 RepID=A0A848FFP0_9BURK|nr:Crp/Fnr family transcriptional regulator [Azohydromonas caseinilytica]NML17655.1 Crp/Fnr family transcriptional regulator [Azohydromonas caseinilytica]
MLQALAPAAVQHPCSSPSAAGSTTEAPWQRGSAPGPQEHPGTELPRLLQQCGLPLRRRLVHDGDVIYRSGDAFTDLHLLHAGIVKTVATSSDGREQVVGLHFKGDWLGFDGIAGRCYGCDAVALDTGEVWSVRYDTLIAAALDRPELLGLLHAAMSREIARDRASMLSLCTLSADARVADFLRQWVEALEQRGLRTDRITLCLSRAEIGNYLGMTLESVSRALSRLAKARVIRFAEKGRRHVEIPDPRALGACIERSLEPGTAVQ